MEIPTPSSALPVLNTKIVLKMPGDSPYLHAPSFGGACASPSLEQVGPSEGQFQEGVSGYNFFGDNGPGFVQKSNDEREEGFEQHVLNGNSSDSEEP